MENIAIISQFIKKETKIQGTVMRRYIMGRPYWRIYFTATEEILTVLEKMLPHITTPHWKTQVKQYIKTTEEYGKERIPIEEGMHRKKYADKWRRVLEKIEKLKEKHPWLKQ